eukprot:CAMPEP_0183440074 /NCGR_PEP_ID=MMETSP0370-20130417/80212_1 /TAXON_ID=268820 /ORGANISM="Peridinium aciculiferum, Strain PAER-2" /LENGTH=51 /DNA_ID=CAMNT_0025628791 /DNA_START=105 /DNA_END=256 /DNA_ORIENTATION=+
MPGDVNRRQKGGVIKYNIAQRRRLKSQLHRDLLATVVAVDASGERLRALAA